MMLAGRFLGGGRPESRTHRNSRWREHDGNTGAPLPEVTRQHLEQSEPWSGDKSGGGPRDGGLNREGRAA